MKFALYALRPHASNAYQRLAFSGAHAQVRARGADPSPQETTMITPINTPHPIDARQVVQPPAEPKPDPHAQTPPVHKSGEVSQDQVTLKSAAQPDPDRE
jgi:hypothetical protein